MGNVIFHTGILLLNQNRILLKGRLAFPCLIAPCMVCPTKTEREIRSATCHHLIERTLQKLPTTAKPIVIITKPLYTGLLRQRSLKFPHFWQAQIIEAQISRNPRLKMPPKEGFGFSHICPFREASPPPFVILRYWMELWKI